MEIVIVSAKRSPIGSFGGALATLTGVELGTQVVKSLFEECKIDPQLVDEVILGQVLTSGCGQNPARQTAINAGISVQSSALTINAVCGSGLKAIILGAQSILNGDADIIVAGGQESMSNAAHSLPNGRTGQKMGDMRLIDTMISDGLWDAFNDYHMGITAENLIEHFDCYQLDRSAQDSFAMQSHHKAANAQINQWFKSEITPIDVPKRRGETVVFSEDEGIKTTTNIETLAKLRPAFKRDGGTVTAGNASSLNDGAAAVLIMSKDKAIELQLEPLATIKSFASAGVDPSIMGAGPIPATKKALKKAGMSINEIDLIEANEAFAVQALSVQQALNISTEKLNIAGGAIALGHPIGASGCRVLVTLIHQMIRTNAKTGLATLCIGGGQGVAMIIER